MASLTLGHGRPLLTVVLVRGAAVLCTVFLVACAGEGPHPRERIPLEGPWNDGTHLDGEPQSEGYASLGRQYMLAGDFMTCGLPFKLWENTLTRGFVSQALGAGSGTPTIDDRPGVNAELPYPITAFTTPDTGVHVLNANCLLCHGATFNGELVIGMGDTTLDFTGVGAGSITISDEIYDSLGFDEAEREETERVLQRFRALAEFSTMRTVGHNPADMSAAVLMAHRDPETLAWSDEPLVPTEIVDHDGEVIEDPIVTARPPPLWRAHKKNALFYNGMARGDHRATMAFVSSVCVDTVDRAREVDEQFQHVQAYVKTLRPPPYPFAIDQGLARDGEDLFLLNCAGCHGTYGSRASHHWYPNLIFPLDVIGTDPVLAEAGVVHAPDFITRFNSTFYGSITRLVPDDPYPGYMAPPLDGIWAAAPYLHNGSVPTIELVLNSPSRPTYWKRVDYDDTRFDEEAMGWAYEVVPYPQAEAPDEERKHIYDTTYFSQSNAGHDFGDHLTAAQRRAIIEYLKTL
jgi:hypothetical protein